MFNDEELFDCPDSCLVTGCEEEFDKVFGKKEQNIKGLFFLLIFCSFRINSNIFSPFSNNEIEYQEVSLSCMEKQSWMERKQ